MKSAIIITGKTNVYENLALESWLLKEILKEKEPIVILFLWQNENCVVVGKNQNPLYECNFEKIDELKVKIARRITGGGAVYHDFGNLNFSFLSANNASNKETNFEILRRAFQKLGIEIEITGRNDIFLKGKKISGNAYYVTKNAHLHHGTILIDMNLKLISEILTPNKLKYKKMSVKSHKSNVQNIKDLYPKIGKNELIEVILEEFKREFKATNYDFKIDEDEVQKIAKKYASKKYIYEKNQKSGEKISADFPFGHADFRILYDGEKIKKFSITTDILDTWLIEKIEKIICKNEKIEKEIFADFEKKLSASQLEILNAILNFLLN